MDAKIPPRAAILDVGTGNGSLLTAIQDRFPGKYRLFGLDNSDAMLARAAINFKIHCNTGSIKTPVTILHGQASQTSLPDRCIDLLVLGNTLHWLLQDNDIEQRSKEEMRRISHNETRIAVITHRPNKLETNGVQGFWGDLLSELKRQPGYNNQSAFATARARCGGDRVGMVSKFIDRRNCQQYDINTQYIITEYQQAAAYFKAISPYSNITEQNILSIVKIFFENYQENGIIKTSWKTTIHIGTLALPNPETLLPLAETQKPSKPHCHLQLQEASCNL